ncbi:hypothetical protein [Prescottella subtropica]|uniref:hypothetical protein n=1 Tax=Prescottella subtropica TaxID=2545757 RepID=UPI0010F52158|nr:hypothetical protein [Prescottella subtropica]
MTDNTAAVTLTVLDCDCDCDDVDNPPAHESTHPSINAAVTALEQVLVEAGEGDRAVHRADDTDGSRRTYDVIDHDGHRVGTAVIDYP